jgi:YVTN family beta-propeller protein
MMTTQHTRVLPSSGRGVRAASTWTAIGAVLVVASLWQSGRLEALVEVTRFAGPISAQPLALSGDGSFLAAVNPDNNSVSVFDLRGDKNKRLAMVPVQTEPNGVVLTPNGRRAFVANTVSGTVSVMDLNLPNGFVGKPRKHITVGVEPYSLVLSPNATKLYVANARSNTISVISTTTETVVKTIPVATEPRGLAMSNDEDGDDADEVLYVSHFLSFPVAGKTDGSDDAKAGRVTTISTATDAVTSAVVVNPLVDSGFKANGDALQRIAPGANFTFTTGAYPNQLNNVAIKGNFAYLPNTGASPNGPVRFDVNTQSLLAVINRGTGADAGRTINMHRAVAEQTAPDKLFITQPWAMAFKHLSDEGYVVSAASNVVVKVTVDPATGAPTVALNPADLTHVLEVAVGKNPRGIVVNPDDTRAYVMNYVSRDVSVIDLTGPVEVPMATIPSAPLPAPGTRDATIQIGKELYNTSVGVFDPAFSGGPAIVGRMSKNGWGACSACHPNGLTDNVVWIFPPGPRRTISQHTDFDRSDPTRSIIRALNWSAERDEEEDFELNIRAVSGGDALIVLGDGVSQDPAVTNLTPLANGGRRQLTVNGVPAWDAIKAYVQFGIRGPMSPVSKVEPDVIAGRALFTAANCQQCHGGAQWTSSRVRFTPPPAAGLIVNGQIASELRRVGTFDPAAFNEVRQNGAAPLGSDGFAPPSLLGVAASPGGFLHGGGAASLDVVLQNVTHRSAGTSGVDVLSNAADRAKIARFLQSIDAASAPIP